PCRCSRGRGTSAGRFGGCISSWLRRLTGRRFSNRRSRTFCDCSVHCFLQGCIFPKVIVSRPRTRRPDLEEHVRESYRQKNIVKTQRPGPSSVLGCRLISHLILRFVMGRTAKHVALQLLVRRGVTLNFFWHLPRRIGCQ